MRARIEKLVQGILLRHWNGILPVDVMFIAEKRGCRVRLIEGLSYNGEVCRVDGGYEIRCKADDHEVRRRFTIAHELGHVELGHLNGREKCLRDTRESYVIGTDKLIEREANHFAAALLMPAQAVRAVVAEMRNPNIERMARLFKVSRIAMGIRLKQLGIIPNWVPLD